MSRILQLKICLKGIKPVIWRKFLVKDDISFEKLHNIIQEIMGWENYHLWEFNINDNIITPPEDEGGFNPAEGSIDKLFKSPEFLKMFGNKSTKDGVGSLDVEKVNEILNNVRNQENAREKLDIETPINKLINKEGTKFLYRYDFGDGWRHEVIVEKAIPDRNQKVPTCLEGERACPPEDCGGVWGYQELLEIQKDKNHPDYEEKIIEWLGEDFDFEEFDLNEVNKLLSRF